MTGFLAAVAVMALPQQVERGRDPWVFRAIFEDRPRSVVVAAGNEVWFAFNPTTCAWHKVWKGSVDFKGKVFDFSQDSSLAVGTVLAQSSEEVFRLPNEAQLPAGWRANGVTWNNGWDFEGDGAYIESPEFDLSGYTTLYVAFDERSRKGRLRVEVMNEGKATEWFLSSTDVGSDTNWMWNFKYLLDRGSAARLRFKQDKAGDEKMMRSARMFGDRPGWALMGPGGLEEATPRFRGIEEDGTRSVHLEFDLVGKGGMVSLRVRPETMAFGGVRRWSAAYTVTGSSGGLRPVMLGWNRFLEGNPAGSVVTWKGLEGTVLTGNSFQVGGEVR